MTFSLEAEPAPSADDGFRHEAFFYAGETEFIEGASAFLRKAIDAGDPALVVVSVRKIDLLRRRLRSDLGQVVFADMEAVGTNPARIIPAWTDFVGRHAGRRLHGIGEPIWAQRSSAELVECQWHESLLNIAFAGHGGFALMCPYDTDALDRDVVAEARRSHPLIRRQGAQGPSDDYLGTEAFQQPMTTPLPPPPRSCVERLFQIGSLGGLRALVLDEAMKAGFSEGRAGDAVVAVNEVVSNSLRHAGGIGVLRIWAAGDTLVCEVTDGGRIGEPLVGRERPDFTTPGGRGLWMVHQLCELVQVRSGAGGTTVRMHLRRHAG
jgi:anti-sigma regulatory factor (Ser/Thr protein kinase)